MSTRGPFPGSLERLVAVRDQADVSPQCVLLSCSCVVLGRGLQGGTDVTRTALREFTERNNLSAHAMYVALSKGDGGASNSLSRFHCVLWRHPKQLRWYVEDLNSKNGTWVAMGASSTPVRLKPREPYEISPVQFDSQKEGGDVRISLSAGASQITFEVFTFGGDGGIRLGMEFQATVKPLHPSRPFKAVASGEDLGTPIPSEDLDQECVILLGRKGSTKTRRSVERSRAPHPSPHYKPSQAWSERKRTRFVDRQPLKKCSSILFQDKGDTDVVSLSEEEEEEEEGEDAAVDGRGSHIFKSAADPRLPASMVTETGMCLTVGDAVKVAGGVQGRVMAIKDPAVLTGSQLARARVCVLVAPLQSQWVDDCEVEEVVLPAPAASPPGRRRSAVNGSGISVDSSMVIDLCSPHRSHTREESTAARRLNPDSSSASAAEEDPNTKMGRAIDLCTCRVCNHPAWEPVLVKECGCLLCGACWAAAAPHRDTTCPVCLGATHARGASTVATSLVRSLLRVLGAPVPAPAPASSSDALPATQLAEG